MLGQVNIKINKHEYGPIINIMFLLKQVNKDPYCIPLNSFIFNRTIIVTNLFRNKTRENDTPRMSWYLTFILRQPKTQLRSLRLPSTS